MEKFSEEIENEIKGREEELSIDTSEYKEVKDAIESFGTELGKAKEEIKKMEPDKPQD